MAPSTRRVLGSRAQEVERPGLQEPGEDLGLGEEEGRLRGSFDPLAIEAPEALEVGLGRIENGLFLYRRLSPCLPVIAE